MKKINNYILEKLKINKDSKVTQNGKDYLSNNEFIGDIELKLKLSDGEGKSIIDKCFGNDIDLKKYEYLYIDPNIYKNDWRFDFQLREAEEWLHDRERMEKEPCLYFIYEDHKKDFSIWHYINVNLSGDNGDEHYVYFMDKKNDKFYIYEFIKEGKADIKKFD